MKAYVPSAGDIVWLEFNPQAGRRPAMVLSKKAYNQKTGLGIFCPITSKIKGYPFEVVISGEKISGAILSDQVKSLDWKARKISFIEHAENAVIQEVISKVSLIIE